MGDLFTARQKVVLAELGRFARSQHGTLRDSIALVVDRCAHQMSHVCRWNVPGEKVEGTFSRQALPIVWDYAEVNPFGNGTGSYNGALDWVAKVIEAWPGSDPGQVQRRLYGSSLTRFDCRCVVHRPALLRRRPLLRTCPTSSLSG